MHAGRINQRSDGIWILIASQACHSPGIYEDDKVIFQFRQNVSHVLSALPNRQTVKSNLRPFYENFTTEAEKEVIKFKPIKIWIFMGAKKVPTPVVRWAMRSSARSCYNYHYQYWLVAFSLFGVLCSAFPTNHAFSPFPDIVSTRGDAKEHCRRREDDISPIIKQNPHKWFLVSTPRRTYIYTVVDILIDTVSRCFNCVVKH